MKLYLVQHGEAVAKDVDPDRPLSEQGQTDVARLAALLATLGVQVEHVLHSGKTRARQTAKALGQATLKQGLAEAVSGIAPNDSTEPFAETIATWHEDTLVVGHLPFMARLVSRLLLNADDPPVVGYQPGSMVCLEQDSEGAWRLIWMLRPELLAGSS